MKFNSVLSLLKAWIKTIVGFVCVGLLKLLSQQTTEQSKMRLLKHLRHLYGEKVEYGLFKGMKLGFKVWWSKYDLITKFLGVYEEHILDQLNRFYSTSNVPFVDIGAADGYFAVGVARLNWAEKVFAFEISPTARSTLKENAERNNCINKIDIRGEATLDEIANIITVHPCVFVLVDIEGAEYELFNDKLLDLLKHCTIIIELHPRKIEDGWSKQAKLIEDAAKLFKTEILIRETYNPNTFKELSEFSDDDRLIAFSEGRKANGQWLFLSPISG
jgi:predicted O-methyltransferase YrrM